MKLIQGDCLEELKKLDSESVNCCVTSPPYWALRDYGVEGQLGLEPTFQEYITKLCDIFDEVKRVLRKDGTCWVNLGDTYGGTGSGQKDTGKHGYTPETMATTKDKPQSKLQGKSLIQIPARFSIEMCNRGWILRNEIIWHKPNCMPSSVKDRFTVDFEKIFFFVKSKKYWFETQREGHTSTRWGGTNESDCKQGDYSMATKAGRRSHKNDYHPDGRNKRTVWKINTKPFKGAHFAVFPEDLIETPIKAGCPKGGVVIDIFSGAGTTGVVAKKQGKDFIGIELNEEYYKIAEKRISQTTERLL